MTDETQQRPVPYVPGYTTPPPAAPEPETPAAAAPRRRAPLIAAAAVLAVLAAAGVLYATGRLPGLTGTITVRGTLVLASGYDTYNACGGTGGHADIRQGAQITVTDSAGATIALGALPAGSRLETGCTFNFEVPNVPAGKSFYGVEVSHRGAIRYTEADLARPVTVGIG